MIIFSSGKAREEFTAGLWMKMQHYRVQIYPFPYRMVALD